MQDRLLNVYLTGSIEEITYKSKTNDLKSEAAKTDEALAKLGDMDPARGELAVTLFDWTQRAADVWRGSNNAVRREILDAVCLNRCLNDVNLVLTKRKPFDEFAEGPFLKNSRGDWRLTFPNDPAGIGVLWFALSQTLAFSADRFFLLGDADFKA